LSIADSFALASVIGADLVTAADELEHVARRLRAVTDGLDQS